MITFTGGTNNNEITGDGDLNIARDVINSESVQQNTVTIADGASLITDADNLVTDTGVRNVGELEFTGGTNNNEITGDGDLI